MPAADHLSAFVDGGDDVVAPRLWAVVAVGTQPPRIAVDVTRFVVAIMAIDFSEPPSPQEMAQLALPLDGQAFEARMIGHDVGLARQPQVVRGRLRMRCRVVS